MKRTLMALALLLPRSALAVEPAARPGPVAEIEADLDGDGRPERISMDGAGVLHARDAAGSLLGEIAAPPGAAPPRAGAATVEARRGGGRTWVLGRSPQAGRAGRVAEQVGLVDGGRVVPVASLLAGPQGADGEWSLHVAIEDEGLTRFQRAPGVARCDGYDRLFVERFDPGAGVFRPVAATVTRGEPIEASGRPPDVIRSSPLGVFRFQSASTRRGDGRAAVALAPPRELDDGRLESAWYAGSALESRGAFATARSLAGPEALAGVAIAPAAGNHIEGLSLFLGGGAPHGSGGGGGGTTHLQIPITTRGGEAGRWLWIPLLGRSASCLSVSIDGATRRGRLDETGLAEVRIYTALDAPGGATRLIDRIEAGGPGTDALLPLLAPHAAEVARALPSASPTGRRMLLRALAGSASAEAATALVGALPTAGADDRAFIAGALARGPLELASRPSLRALMRDRSSPEVARAVALDLVSRAPGGPTAVWQALGDGALDGTALGEVAVRAIAGAPIDQALAAIGDEPERSAVPPSPARQLARLRVLGVLAGRAHASGNDQQRSRATALLLPLAPPPDGGADASTFEARFRFLRAARQARSAALLPAVATLARDSDEAVRWAAVEAAAALDGGAGQAVIRAGTADADPRVRAAAIRALPPAPLPVTSPHQTALLDRWPMVRQAAAERLATGCPGGDADALERATSDGDAGVAGAALAALARCAPQRGAAAALRLLRDPRASRAVREQAVPAVVQLRPAGSARALSEALEDLLDHPGSDERSVGLAGAMVRAIGTLADPAGEPGLQRAAAESALPPLRAMALGALASLCTATARATVNAARDDGDPLIKRAASSALTRCR